MKWYIFVKGDESVGIFSSNIEFDDCQGPLNDDEIEGLRPLVQNFADDYYSEKCYITTENEENQINAGV